MLRQALDAANDYRPEVQGSTETDSLLPDTQEQSYAATSATHDEYDQLSEESRSYEDEEDYLIQDWQENSIANAAEVGILGKAWKGIKACFVLVVNVENLWDSPQMHGPQASRRNHLVVLFWFFILATSYACERSTFKLLVDRTGPFRLFAVEMVTFIHALMVGTGMFISAVSRKDFKMQPLGIPFVDVGLMALLDTVQMLLVFLTGPHVAPTLTAILVQLVLPLTALITQFVHRDGCIKRCCGQRPDSDSVRQNEGCLIEGRSMPGWGGLSLEHLSGSVIISLAVLLALSPAIYSLFDAEFFLYADEIPTKTAYNTILFVSSCIPAAASQLYKEHIFLQYKQPVQADYLNFVLSTFQLVFASIMAPLVYTLQGLKASKDWTKLYPSRLFSKNFAEGFACFTGTLDGDRAKNGYEEEASCSYSLSLVFFHCFSIIAIGVAVDKIVNAGATKVMYRGVSAGIIFSVICLYIYDLNIPDFSYGPAIDSLNLVCLLLLVVGAEV